MLSLVLLGYSLVFISVLCAGSFGIGIRHREEGFNVISYSLLTLVAAAVWPLSIPIYLSFKKGSFYGPKGIVTKAKEDSPKSPKKRTYIKRGKCVCQHNWSSHEFGNGSNGSGECTAHIPQLKRPCACQFYVPDDPTQDVYE